MRATVGLLVLVLAVGGCYGSDPDEPQRGLPAGAPTFGNATVIIATDDDPVLVPVEVAEKAEQHAFGLMHRKSLDAEEGMVFVFFEERTDGFWMKDTFIPLSVAFFDIEGSIVRILDMEPCRADPCEIYEPGVPYMGALEVNQGAFERWSVEEGDVIELSR